jgi:heterodisulfide reductase subunit A
MPQCNNFFPHIATLTYMMKEPMMSTEKRSVGVFLCKCGTNIAGAVDMEALADWTKGQEETAWVHSHELLCSPDGQQYLRDVIKSEACDSVVIAACSPKMHEKTFRDAAGERFNCAHVNMVNIREQAAWVTPDAAEALEKAKALILGGLRRAQRHEDLTLQSMECLTDVVIIGGGIAAVETALMLARAGRKVVIVEKDISLGGNVIKTEEVAPAMECAPCLLAPRLSELRDNKNITVVTNAEVTDVLGFFGNFTVKALRRARSVTPSCIGCEACFEVCPVSVPSSFHLGMGNRKAVYTAFPGSVPAAAVIDRTACLHFTDGSCSACKDACPFGAIDFDDKDEHLEFSAGAVVLATGGSDPDVSKLYDVKPYPAGTILTMPQFERLASSNGPTGGEIRKGDGSPVKSIAVLHCAGSLREDGLPYCSGICCMNAFKAGDLFRKKVGGGSVTNIHDRLVVTGPAQQHFFHEQKDGGTKFIATTRLTEVALRERNGKVLVTVPEHAPFEVDMVVLSTGMGPSESAAEIAGITAIDRNRSGFYRAGHSLLQATGSSLDGIYIAGACASPCDVSTAITRGQSAAGDILSKLVPGRKLDLELMTAYIDGELCAGCKLCIAVCPYKAISFDKNKAVSVVNEAICRGCGTCAATCPGSAAHARHFTNRQMVAELKGVLDA